MNNQNEYTAENFITAVNVLFNSKDKGQQAKANRYLVDFDKSVLSWEIAIQIMSIDNLNEIVYFNALNVLKNKIKFEYGNYTENTENITSFLKFLIDKIDSFKNKEHFLIINLCKCYAIGMVFSVDNFENIMKYCVNRLNANNNMKNLLSLLMIYNYLTEIKKLKDIVVNGEIMRKFYSNLDVIEYDVMNYINMMVKLWNKIQSYHNENDEIEKYQKNCKCYIFETFTNWISFGLKDETLKRLLTDNIDIINFVFNIEEAQIQKHSECICILLQLPFEKEEMKKLGRVIIGKVMGLIEIYYQRKGKLNSEEISFYIDILASLCTISIDEIINEKQFKILQLLVEFTKQCPSGKISLICDVWVLFMEEFSIRRIPPSEVLKEFKSLFIQMILYMINLMQYSNEIFRELNIKKKKEVQSDSDYITINEYRQEIKYFFSQFAYKYSFEFMYNEIIFPEIENTIHLIKSTPNEIKNWSHLETLLYSFNCFCKEINKYNDIVFLNTLFDTVFDIQKDFVQIIRTVTDILDEMEDIIGKK